MYREFYQLKEIPFGLTPDPRYIFKTESYLEVIANLRYGIRHHKGLVVVTGEVGTGKTTTLRSMLQQFGHEILAVYLFNPFVTVREFFDLLTRGLHLGLPPAASKSEVLSALARFLSSRHGRGQRTVLIVDEAHGLPPAVLEEIRLLANFETNSEKLLQIILCGQPELRETLNQAALRQLKQRVSLRCALKPLAAYEVGRYIRFRLKMAGGERVDLFDDEAVELIALISQGIPRVINNVCDNALLHGFASGAPAITRHVIEEVIALLDLDSGVPLTNESIETDNWATPAGEASHAAEGSRF